VGFHERLGFHASRKERFVVLAHPPTGQLGDTTTLTPVWSATALWLILLLGRRDEPCELRAQFGCACYALGCRLEQLC